VKQLRDNDYGEDIRTVAEKYAVSWYATVDHIAVERVIDGATVPVAAGDERLTCLRENVEEAKFNRDGIRRRYEQAQRDGLFDLKRANDVDGETLSLWLAAVETQKGDKNRCIGELAHWREYLGLALKGELPQLKRASRDIVRDLVAAKSYGPDTRLPPERDEAEMEPLF
jgi:hypothetical protein